MIAFSPPWLEIRRRDAPVVVSIPHTGIEVPAEIASAFRSDSLALVDQDWHVEQLYDFAADLGATVVRTRMARSVIDVNRDPTGLSLYPGLVTTQLCPTVTFDGRDIYLPELEPDSDEINRRRLMYFDPYHEALAAELRRLKRLHGHAILLDAHSIRSHIARLFAGELPHVNIGTNSGRSASPPLILEFVRLAAESQFTYVLDGRFKGGWSTRHYGQPERATHAIQLELAQRSYLVERSDTARPNYDPRRARPMRHLLQGLLRMLLSWKPESLHDTAR